MGLQFDWEVEDAEPAPRLDAESPETAGRDNRARRLIGWGVAAVILAVAAYGGFRWEQRRVDERLHQELETVVSAELTTLRIGDEHAFEKLQTGSEDWLSIQSHTFERYQQGASAYQYLTGDIDAMTVEAGQGTVHLTGSRDGEPFCVVWRYEYGRDGWQHVDSPPEPCGADALHLEGQRVAIDAYPADAAYSQDLLDRIDPWLEDLCALTECASYPRPLTVRVLPDYSIIPRLEDETTLVIPSPALTPEAGPPVDSDTVLAGQLGDFWAEETLRTAAPGAARSRWMRENLGQLAHAAWMGDPAEAYLGRLADQYGADVVHGLLMDWAVGQTSNEVLADAVGPGMQRGDADLRATFEILLQTEATLLESGDDGAAAAYRYPQWEFPPDWNLFLSDADPTSIRVASTFQTGFDDQITWAEVYWQRSPDAPFLYGGSHSVQSRTYVPFRQVEDRWARTVILADDYGAPREVTQGYYTVAYRAGDERLVQPVLVALSEIYPLLAADVGLDPLPPVNVTLTPSAVEYFNWWNEGRVTSPESIDLVVTSSYEWCCTGNLSLERSVVNSTQRRLIDEVIEIQTGSLTDWEVLRSAFVNWFERQYGLTEDFPREAVYRDLVAFDGQGRSPIPGLPSSLTQVWLDFKVNQQEPWGTNEIAVGVLVDVLMDTYGPSVMEPLLASVDQADTLDDWLMMSVGGTVDFIEPLWQARMEEVLADIQAEALTLRQAQGTQ